MGPVCFRDVPIFDGSKDAFTYVYMMCNFRKKKNKSRYLKLNLLCVLTWQIEESKIMAHDIFNF